MCSCPFMFKGAIYWANRLCAVINAVQSSSAESFKPEKQIRQLAYSNEI